MQRTLKLYCRSQAYIRRNNEWTFMHKDCTRKEHRNS